MLLLSGSYGRRSLAHRTSSTSESVEYKAIRAARWKPWRNPASTPVTFRSWRTQQRLTPKEDFNAPSDGGREARSARTPSRQPPAPSARRPAVPSHPRPRFLSQEAAVRGEAQVRLLGGLAGFEEADRGHREERRGRPQLQERRNP